jgi:hypothetical protein
MQASTLIKELSNREETISSALGTFYYIFSEVAYPGKVSQEEQKMRNIAILKRKS